MQNYDCAPRLTTCEFYEEFALERNVSLLTVVKLKLFVKNHRGFLITEVIKNSA